MATWSHNITRQDSAIQGMAETLSWDSVDWMYFDVNAMTLKIEK